MVRALLGCFLALVVLLLPAVPGEASHRPGHNPATATPTRTPTPQPAASQPTATPVAPSGPSGLPQLPPLPQLPVQPPASRKVFLPSLARDKPAARTAMAVGTNVIDNNYEMVRDMGFPWMKLYHDWDGADPEAQVNDALRRYPGAKILLRFDRSPAHARTGVDDDPINHEMWRNHLRNIVSRLRGKVQAYELFNEPNLKWEWNNHIAGGGGSPSVRGYARILQTGYVAIKEMDPDAIVITGGLSSAGNGGSEAIGDLAFLEQLYANGARGYFDGVGTHPYGGPFAWNDGRGHETGVYFFRAEEQYGVLVRQGDAHLKMWATELGWLVDPRVYGYGHCMPGLGGRADWVRSPDDVAAQLIAAYRHAADSWPWMAGMFFFNFDYSAAGWVQGYDKTCDAPAWYSIANKNNMLGRPYFEPAYYLLRAFSAEYRL